MIADMYIPKPPKHEQERITEVLLKIERYGANEYAVLNKLRSIKTALMQDLLTGKVRVTPLLEKEQQEACA